MQLQCSHPSRQEFPAEINIHFPGMQGLTKPTVWVFPSVLVCLDCGCTEFATPDRELRALANGIKATEAAPHTLKHI